MSKTDGLLLNRIKGISDLSIQKISLYLLLLWICYPLVAMLLNLFNVDGTIVYTLWLLILYFAGAIGLVFGAINLFKKDDYSFSSIKLDLYENLPLVFLALFILWSLLCCLFADDKHMAFYGIVPMSSSWFTFLFFGGFIVEAMNVAKNKKYVLVLARVLIGVSAIQSIFTILNNDVSRCVNIAEPYTNCFEYQSVFCNTNHYAYYLLMTTLLAFFMVGLSKSIFEKIVCLLIYILQINLLILNNTLGAYLSLALTILIVILWKFINNENNKIISIVLLVVFVIVSACSMLYSDNIKTNVFGLSSDMSTIIGDEDTASVGSGRGELWKNALYCVKESPVFGCGFENHGKFGPSVDSSNEVFVTQPHNFLLFYAKYTGIPGLLLYLSALISGVVKLIKNREMNNSATETAAFIMVAYLASEFFGVIKFYTAPYYCIALGFCLLAYRELESNQYEKKSN